MEIIEKEGIREGGEEGREKKAMRGKRDGPIPGSSNDRAHPHGPLR